MRNKTNFSAGLRFCIDFPWFLISLFIENRCSEYQEIMKSYSANRYFQLLRLFKISQSVHRLLVQFDPMFHENIMKRQRKNKRNDDKGIVKQHQFESTYAWCELAVSVDLTCNCVRMHSLDIKYQFLVISYHLSATSWYLLVTRYQSLVI